MKRALLLVFLFIGISFLKVSAQSCFNIAAGPDIHTSCTNLCFPFKARVPDVRTSEDYKVISIPYTPYPYVTAAPPFLHPCNVDPGTDQDDKFVDQATLPFNFCFYGKILTQYIIGTNGVISFDKNDALKSNNYEVTNPLPFFGGAPQTNGCNTIPSGARYPKLSILGLYHDMWPEVGDPYKIEARIEGTAPCRKFIMSYNEVKLYECTSVTSTFQVVLHEGTGLIDVYIKEKPVCATNVIIGIQDFDNSKAISPPGRELFTKSLREEAWRFVPNGTTSLLSRVELYKNGVFMATGTTTDLGTGELEVDFGNLCQPEDSAGYVIRAFYKQCDNPALETEGSDSISVVKTLNPISVSTTATSCPTSADGTITVDNPVGPNIEYSIDGGTTWQTSPVFTVGGGSYTIIARVIGSVCTGTTTTNVTSAPTVTVATNVTEPDCPGNTNGSITVTFPNTAGNEYSIDGGTTWQLTPTFPGLGAGTYTIDVRLNPSGCTGSTTVTINNPPPLPITPSVSPVLCNGSATGTIAITNPVGADYEYSIDGGTTWQASNTFNVTAGAYTITVRRISTGCINTQNVTVTEPPALSATAAGTKAATCANNDGELTVTANGGVAPYSYSINNGTSYQPSNIFAGLGAGTYSQNLVRDANNCTFAVNPVTIALNDTMRLELGADTSLCAGSNITLDPQTNDLVNVFSWTPSAGLSNSNIKNPVASPVDTIKYYLTATWGVCQREDSITVNVKHKPQVYAGRDTTICFNTDALLHGTVTNLSGTVNYAWTPAASLATPAAITTIAHPDSTQNYTLTVTDNYNCSFSVSDVVRVTVNPVVVAFAGNDTNAIANRPHQLRATGGVSYTWTPSAPLNSAVIPNPLATLSNDTYFTVTVKDGIGCMDTDDVFVKVYDGPEYYVPNAFTPNGDGLNDVFRPIPVGMRSTEYFRVFDRYGKVVFETREWMKGWDGMVQGKKATTGTYVWTVKGVDTNGRTVELKGTVLLLQ